MRAARPLARGRPPRATLSNCGDLQTPPPPSGGPKGPSRPGPTVPGYGHSVEALDDPQPNPPPPVGAGAVQRPNGSGAPHGALRYGLPERLTASAPKSS